MQQSFSHPKTGKKFMLASLTKVPKLSRKIWSEDQIWKRDKKKIIHSDEKIHACAVIPHFFFFLLSYANSNEKRFCDFQLWCYLEWKRRWKVATFFHKKPPQPVTYVTTRPKNPQKLPHEHVKIHSDFLKVWGCRLKNQTGPFNAEIVTWLFWWGSA